MEIKNTIEVKEVAEFIKNKILKQLENNRKVLLFVTGGSGIKVAIALADTLSKTDHARLVVMLTDERYGEINNPNSNWHQLLELGFTLPNANLIPILDGNERKETKKKFNDNLKKYLTEEYYKIGLFGVGADGHTAGILPHTDAVNSLEFAYDYTTPQFERITMTPKAIEKLDEIVVFMKGEEKWPVVENLKNENFSLTQQPAQVLKKVSLLTIFTDYKN